MAAFTGTPASGAAYTDQATAPRVKTTGGKVVQIYDSELYTHALGAGTGEVNLFSLSGGVYIFFPHLSFVVTTQYAANADLHLGYRAHTAVDGTTTVVDDNAFADNEDAGGGALSKVLTLPPVALSVRDEVVIYAMIDTGNIEDTDTLRFWLAGALIR